MKTIVEYLSKYAFYHQDRKNVVTHFIGIPMILVAIIVLLSRPQFSVFGLEMAPAIIVVFVCSVFYLYLDYGVGFLMTALLGLSLWFSNCIAAQITSIWLSIGIGLFIVGWVVQFVGHYFEGKKPAFVDDIMGLIIGPLFVVVEGLFLLGMKKSWKDDIKTYCEQKNHAEML